MRRCSLCKQLNVKSGVKAFEVEIKSEKQTVNICFTRCLRSMEDRVDEILKGYVMHQKKLIDELLAKEVKDA